MSEYHDYSEGIIVARIQLAQIEDVCTKGKWIDARIAAARLLVTAWRLLVWTKQKEAATIPTLFSVERSKLRGYSSSGPNAAQHADAPLP